jgi:hypothetical protein
MAEQRNTVAPMSVATDESAPEPKLNRFFQRARILFVFLVGVALGALSLSVFAKEFSSPTSLRPSTLATTTEQFVALGSDGEPLVKTHVQATNYVKPAVTTKRTMNSTFVARRGSNTDISPPFTPCFVAVVRSQRPRTRRTRRTSVSRKRS